MPQAERKVKGTIHWVSAAHAVTAEVRLYDHLFSKPDPEEVPAGQNYLANLNPNSLEVLADAQLEPSWGDAKAGERFQFERTGYFIADVVDSKAGQAGFQSDGNVERHLGEDRTKRWRKINPSDPELYHGQMRLLQWHDYFAERKWRAIVLRGGLSAKSPNTRFDNSIRNRLPSWCKKYMKENAQCVRETGLSTCIRRIQSGRHSF